MADILLGVGGGIAAYKSCELLRRLQDLGHEVTVVPTPASLNFVGKATWEALSGKPVATQVWEGVPEVQHVKLGDEADYIILAPATADLIARLAAGRADDLLTNAVLSSNAPKLLVPAMHPKMWLNPVTQANIKKLVELGFLLMEPATGRLTGKDSGVGRFPETKEILEKFQNEILVKQDLKDRRILITTGGTREAIDDVRFIGNRSSGKQGIAIAKIAQARGAQVTLIAVNVDSHLLNKLFNIKIIEVVDTEQLNQSLHTEFPKNDVLIMAAAVSDARPLSKGGKIKKDELASIDLEQTPDLLAQISAMKERQFLVGFAAEERANLLQEGRRKFLAKGLDLIYANDINQGSIFGSDQTSGYLISKSEEIEVINMSKQDLASLLLNKVSEGLKSHNV